MNGYQPEDAAPPWTEEEYQQEIAAMVADESPTVFAVVEDRDDRYDGRIAAWVLEFSSGAEVICTEGGTRMSLASMDRVLPSFGRQPGITARLIQTAHPKPC
jgi:hypothetical protein